MSDVHSQADSGGSTHASSAPSTWIGRFAHLVARGARVLDLAAGHGRHARFFADRGARVVALDRDAAALATFASTSGVETRIADLENAPWPLDGQTFDAIVVVNYLHRPLLPSLLEALAPGGVLLYDTFAQGNERFGRPRNPDFLLRPGELLEALEGRLTVVAFEQGLIDAAGRTAVIERMAAVGPAYPWPPVLSQSGDAIGFSGSR